MSPHNIGFYGEMTKIIFQSSSNTHLICSSVVQRMHSLAPGKNICDLNDDKIKTKITIINNYVKILNNGTSENCRNCP